MEACFRCGICHSNNICLVLEDWCSFLRSPDHSLTFFDPCLIGGTYVNSLCSCSCRQHLPLHHTDYPERTIVAVSNYILLSKFWCPDYLEDFNSCSILSQIPSFAHEKWEKEHSDSPVDEAVEEILTLMTDVSENAHRVPTRRRVCIRRTFHREEEICLGNKKQSGHVEETTTESSLLLRSNTVKQGRNRMRLKRNNPTCTDFYDGFMEYDTSSSSVAFENFAQGSCSTSGSTSYGNSKSTRKTCLPKEVMTKPGKVIDSSLQNINISEDTRVDGTCLEHKEKPIEKSTVLDGNELASKQSNSGQRSTVCSVDELCALKLRRSKIWERSSTIDLSRKITECSQVTPTHCHHSSHHIRGHPLDNNPIAMQEMESIECSNNMVGTTHAWDYAESTSVTEISTSGIAPVGDYANGVSLCSSRTAKPIAEAKPTGSSSSRCEHYVSGTDSEGFPKTRVHGTCLDHVVPRNSSQLVESDKQKRGFQNVLDFSVADNSMSNCVNGFYEISEQKDNKSIEALAIDGAQKLGFHVLQSEIVQLREEMKLLFANLPYTPGIESTLVLEQPNQDLSKNEVLEDGIKAYPVDGRNVRAYHELQVDNTQISGRTSKSGRDSQRVESVGACNRSSEIQSPFTTLHDYNIESSKNSEIQTQYMCTIGRLEMANSESSLLKEARNKEIVDKIAREGDSQPAPLHEKFIESNPFFSDRKETCGPKFDHICTKDETGICNQNGGMIMKKDITGTSYDVGQFTERYVDACFGRWTKEELDFQRSDSLAEEMIDAQQLDNTESQTPAGTLRLTCSGDSTSHDPSDNVGADASISCPLTSPNHILKEVESFSRADTPPTNFKRVGRLLWSYIVDLIKNNWILHAQFPSKLSPKSLPNMSISSMNWLSCERWKNLTHDIAKLDKRHSQRDLIPEELNNQLQISRTMLNGQEICKFATFEGNVNHVKDRVVVSLNTLDSDMPVLSSVEEIPAMCRRTKSQTDINNEGFHSCMGISYLSAPIPSSTNGRASEVAEVGICKCQSDVPNTNQEEQAGDLEMDRRKLEECKLVFGVASDVSGKVFKHQMEQRRIDEKFMRDALVEARKAADIWEFPVGAVLVHDGKIIARGYNLVEDLRDSTAHAEIICIREASRLLRSWCLADTTLYVTLEPCPMCMGAILQARIHTLVWGAPNKLIGADGGWISLLPVGREKASSSESSPCFVAPVHPLHPKMVVRRGILATECSDVLQQSFTLRRRRGMKTEGQPLTYCSKCTRFNSTIRVLFWKVVHMVRGKT